MSIQVITAKDAAQLVFDGATVCSQGMGGNDVAEELMLELENRFLATGHPQHLRWIHSSGQGDSNTRGLNHIGHEGMLDWIIGGHYNPAPRIQKLVVENKIQAYNWPQGVISVMFRDIAANRPTVSRIGLHTFVDPRLEGGRLNSVTTEQIVKPITIDGDEFLLYKHPEHLDFALLRGTYADERGNISLEEEGCYLESLQAAQAVHNSGGKVIVQVKEVVAAGSIDPRLVHIPGIFVDYVIPVADMNNHMMTFDEAFNPALCGSCKRVIHSEVDARGGGLSAKDIISRRAAMELKGHSVINLGIGVPEGVGVVADQEGIRDQLTLSIESGPVGGIPSSGVAFGTSLNPEAILDQSTQFDGYTGGSLDITFLGLAEADRMGNINVSKFGARVSGAGGFIDITQSTKNVVFCGTFTAGGLKTAAENGKLVIVQEGRTAKLVEQVQQITFNGPYAAKCGQHVLYITERAVLELRPEGMTLIEIAPGIDLQTQVLDHMGFVPRIADDLKLMDERIFRDELMGLSSRG